MEKENKLDIKQFIILMLVAFIFSVSVRYIWIEQFKDVESFKWNNELMINTNDGYAYAEGARDMLQGFHEDNDLSYYNSSLSTLTYLLAKLLPISFETLILWMPSIFGSFLVIPIMLIARSLNQEYVGFVAALLGGIAWSYYNRTMMGYYDTDMLTIVLPTFVLWSLILNVIEQRNRYLLLIPFLIILYFWWYGQSYSLSMAMIVMVGLYTLIFDRSNVFNYKILIFMLISIANIYIYFKLGLVFGLFLLFHFRQELIGQKIIHIILAISVLLVFATGGFNPILQMIKVYVFRQAYATDFLDTLQLNFYAVNQTVREAGQIPFETFANRISGSTYTFILSVIGYALLVRRYRVMWLALPMVGLGFLALKGGLRFTVYAVPIMALGASYMIFYVASFLEKLFISDKVASYVKTGFISLATVGFIYPNLVHIQEYKVPTVFTKNEVEILDRLKNIASREDYVATWWDYGYPIRYYSDVKTLIDGGKHTGKDNFAVSYALTSDQISAANMLRFEVEYTELSYKKQIDSNIKQILRDYDILTLDDFYAKLKIQDIKLPSKTRDIFLYLPDRMMSIFPTVALFSSIDLLTGRENQKSFFYQSQSFKDAGDSISLGSNISIQKQGGKISIGQQTLNLNTFSIAAYNNQGNLEVKTQNIDKNSPIHVIFMKSYNRFLVLDNKMFNSTYIQLYVLENYDKNLYEPVILNPYVKVYKLKI